MYRSLAKKPLSLIQIEERAMSELEKAYSAFENPDEFIIVKQSSCQQQHKSQGGLQDSRWSSEV